MDPRRIRRRIPPIRGLPKTCFSSVLFSALVKRGGSRPRCPTRPGSSHAPSSPQMRPPSQSKMPGGSSPPQRGGPGGRWSMGRYPGSIRRESWMTCAHVWVLLVQGNCFEWQPVHSAMFHVFCRRKLGTDRHVHDFDLDNSHWCKRFFRQKIFIFLQINWPPCVKISSAGCEQRLSILHQKK